MKVAVKEAVIECANGISRQIDRDCGYSVAQCMKRVVGPSMCFLLLVLVCTALSFKLSREHKLSKLYTTLLE